MLGLGDSYLGWRKNENAFFFLTQAEELRQVVSECVFLFASDVWKGNSAKGLQPGALSPTSSIQAPDRCLCSRALGFRGPLATLPPPVHPCPCPWPWPRAICALGACTPVCPVSTRITSHHQVCPQGSLELLLQFMISGREGFHQSYRMSRSLLPKPGTRQLGCRRGTPPTHNPSRVSPSIPGRQGAHTSGVLPMSLVPVLVTRVASGARRSCSCS